MTGPAYSNNDLPPVVRTILVVEDEVLIRLHLAEELRRSGYHVHEASSADEAMRLLRTVADIDLLITDIQMPGSMDGLALADWTSQMRPAMKIMIASANRVSGNRTYFHAVVTKPFEMSLLLQTVRELLASAEPKTGRHPRGDFPMCSREAPDD